MAQEPNVDDMELADISGHFYEVAAIVGIAGARALMKRRAGKRLDIAKRPSAELVTDIGPEQAKRLCDEMGGLCVEVPTKMSIARTLRRREMVELRSRGLTKMEIATRVGLTIRAVEYALQNDELNEEPGDGQA
jgi:DNA-binding CsgD family transcriptional regulator